MIKKALFSLASLAALTTFSDSAHAVFIDGKGHYAARGESRQHPGFTSKSAFQAIDQFFRLEAEVRSGDKASFFTEFQLFSDPRQSYMGDDSQPEYCSPVASDDSPAKSGNLSDCEGRHQSTLDPRYKPYSPGIRKAYMKYASERCLLTVGRRGRDWGLGIFLDSGEDIFDESASVFDGVTCDINIQKSQEIGFSVGYDKITETGSRVNLADTESVEFGPKNQSDDLDQLFFTIEYDDTQTATGGFSQKIGIYFANVFGSDDQKTDIKLADLYTAFYLPNMIIRNEILFRLGKSADPNLTRMGGRAHGVDTVNNKVDSIALAGRLDWFLSRTGSLTAPDAYKKGNLTTHAMVFEWAHAPGDKDGYTNQFDANGTTPLRTDKTASAVAFHRNYKPALILFNGRANEDSERVDGIYDPGRVMNANIFSLGYEYKSMESGKFNLKLIHASLSEGMPSSVKSTLSDSEKSYIGYKGTDLGWELDIQYEAEFDDGFQLGGALAVALPGKAWDYDPQSDPNTQFLIQGFAAFKF